MKPVNRIRGRVAIYEGSNIDTDQIVPARFLSRARSAGYGEAFFQDVRLDREGREQPGCVLNRPEYRNPKVLLVVGQNFGCGSSREQAAWAVLDYGIECVIAQSFSDIFTSNSIENGLLLVALPEKTIAELRDLLPESGPSDIEISLERQTITIPSGRTYPFEFNPIAKNTLQKGLTKIGVTMQFGDNIRGFEQNYRERFPWTV